MTNVAYTTSEGGRTMGTTMARLEAETLAIGSILGHIVGVLPSIATALAIAWYAVMLHDWWKARRTK